jgi:MFS family permease
VTEETSEGGVAARPEPGRWRWAVTAAFALGGITVSTWGPRLPAIKASLGIGTATIGLFLAGVTVGAIIGLLASTPVLHRLGSRRSLTAALLLIAVSMTVMAVALAFRSLPLLAICFVVIGTGIGTLDVLINVEGSAIEQATGRTLMPSMHAAWSIGAAVGSGAGAGCAALGITPAAQFAGEAVIIVVAAFGVAAGIPPGNHAPADEPSQDRRAKIREWLRGWLDWRLLLIGVVMLGVELGEGSANSWLTLAVRNNHGQTAAVAALFFTVFATCEGLTRIFAAPVVDRLGRVMTIRLTTALGLAGIVLFIVGGTAGSSSSGSCCGRSGSPWASPSACPPRRRAGPTRPRGSASWPPSATSPTSPDRPSSVRSPSPSAFSAHSGSSPPCSSPPSLPPGHSVRDRLPEHSPSLPVTLATPPHLAVISITSPPLACGQARHPDGSGG